MWAEGCTWGVYYSPAEVCAGRGVSEGACRSGAAVGNRRMPWEASFVCGGYAPEGCAIAPPRGVPEGAPEGCRYWEPPHARGGLLCRRGAPERCTIALPRVCAGWGVPEGCRCWKPSHALGGLRCGRRGAPEGCAIALLRGCAGWGMPEGVCRRGAAVGNHRMSWEASYVGGGVPPEGCGIALPRGACRGRRRGVVVGSRRMPWEASYVGGGVRRRVCHSPAEGCRCWKPSHAPERPPMWAERCAGGVCHSPAEGCARGGCRC